MVIVNPVNNPVLENSAATLTKTETATATATVNSNATCDANTTVTAEVVRECNKKTKGLAAGLGVPLFIALVGLVWAVTAIYKGYPRLRRGPVRATSNGTRQTHSQSVGPISSS
jgi:hypothetical protein